MDPYIGEIRLFAGNFAPKDWAFCDGSLLPISRYTTLFSILGTTYGGDGKTTFALPNLNGRAAMNQGQGLGLSYRQLGEAVGEQAVTLLNSEMPMHNHSASSQKSGGTTSPENAEWSDLAGRVHNVYGSSSNANMNPAALQTAGGNQPHNNMQPYLGLNYIISLLGIYPPHS